MSSRIFSESTIFTGSEFNHRTFNEEESWNSLQSTILAGMNLTIDNNESRGEIEKNKLELTTVIEEGDSLISRGSRDETPDILNMNLDAISDDEVFFDCPGIVTPAKMLFSPRKRVAPSPRASCLTTTNESLNVAVPSILGTATTTSTSVSSADSGLPEGGKTGSLLVEMIDEFKQINDHAHSTPKLTSESSGNPSSLSSIQQVSNENEESNDLAAPAVTNKHLGLSQRKLDFSLGKKIVITYPETMQSENSHVDADNKENYYHGKYTNAVNREKPKATPRFAQPVNKEIRKGTSRFVQPVGTTKPKATPRYKSPVVKVPRHSVAKMAEFFENRSKSTNDQSQFYKFESSKKNTSKSGLQASKSNLQSSKSPGLHKSKSKSPKYHPRGTYKLLKASTENTLNFTPSKATFVIRHKPNISMRNLRPSSCSEVPKDSLSSNLISGDVSLLSLGRRSKSTSDLSSEVSINTQLTTAVVLKRIPVRHTKLSRPREANKSKKASPKVSKKRSEIMKRKSLGFVSSPVKPVQELKKIFSPAANGIQTKRIYGKNLTTNIIPKIVINEDQ